ncbi:MAG TPA: SulP family inorganic anion transporter, partial [Acidimicrobiia bacterium]|nr:SulP family inorganic anion transporter [Acidimicrobiia bacterium]
MDRLFPLSTTIRDYDQSWFRGDLAAAITVWAIVVPESMAYASIAGMPPETGLYAATVPLLLYAVFGTSRRMTVGPSAAVAALSIATVAPFAAAGSEEIVSYTVMLALIVGVVLVVAGIAKLGIIAEFLSEPVLKGFIVGVALTITLGQLGKLFGLESEGEGFFSELFDLIGKLPDLHVATLVVGAISLAGLFMLERFLPKIPSALVVVVLSIIAVKLFDLEAVGVEVAGAIPAGLPSLVAPTNLDWSAVSALIPGAIGVAIVVFGESMALAKTFGSSHGERVDANQELIALGAANTAGGLFGAFVTDGSSSRTAAADTAGQKTQVSSLVVVVLLIVTLLFLTSLFSDLPEAALGAIVIHAVIGLIRFAPIRRLKERNQVDFWAAVSTLVGVLVFDVLAGLMIGVLVSLAGLMSRAVRPRITWLARDTSSDGFIARDRAGAEEL